MCRPVHLRHPNCLRATPYLRLDRAAPNSAETVPTHQTVTIKIADAELGLAERLNTDIPGATTSKVDDKIYKLVLPPNGKNPPGKFLITPRDGGPLSTFVKA